MARTSGAIGMPTQTGTHTLVVGWSAKRKLSGVYGGGGPWEGGFPPGIGWSLLGGVSDVGRDLPLGIDPGRITGKSEIARRPRTARGSRVAASVGEAVA